ncbi:MAG: phosphoglycerate dehydrogenase [Bacillota bacterium]
MKDKKVLVAEKIDPKALRELKNKFSVTESYDTSRSKMLEIIKDFDAIIIRSGTLVDEKFLSEAKKLKVVGRAGNGTDNIDIDCATQHGVIVANTPESNTMSAAELTIAHMLNQSRNVIKANNSLKSGKWNRSIFKGNELFEKTVGIVGLGRIGSLVAERLNSFNMNVIAYDPYISDSRFKRYNVKKEDTLIDLIKKSDYITVHTPRNEETFHMINDDHLEYFKKGVRLVNVARGGIIKEDTIKKGLDQGIIKSAGIDVHEEEPCLDNPLFEYEDVNVTPHLGASTIEAQQNVGSNVIEQVQKALNEEIVPNALNIPTMSRGELKDVKPYLEIMEKLGKIYYQISKEHVDSVKIEYFGKMANKNNQLITLTFLKGLLETVTDQRVNYINALVLAKKRDIDVNERYNEDFYKGYTEFVKITLKNKHEDVTLGCNISPKNEGRLVEYNGYEIDIKPEKYMYIVNNIDYPGVVGTVGTILGEEKVNVATMQLGRNQAYHKAVMLLNVDQKPEDKIVERLEADKNIISVKKIIL